MVQKVFVSWSRVEIYVNVAADPRRADTRHRSGLFISIMVVIWRSSVDDLGEAIEDRKVAGLFEKLNTIC